MIDPKILVPPTFFSLKSPLPLCSITTTGSPVLRIAMS